MKRELTSHPPRQSLTNHRAVALLASSLMLTSCQLPGLGGGSSAPAPSAPAPVAANVAPAGDTAPGRGSVVDPEIETKSSAATLAGFTDTVVFSNLTNPIAVRFATNGKVFVAEENGRIYFYDNLSDTTPTLFADLRNEVNSYWDRGMLGFTLDPNYATNGRMYVLYTHDTATNSENNQSIANRNATDNCPSTPGGTSQGCVTFGRLSRLTDPGSGYPVTARLDLITEWPQQFPSHAIGALNFGPDGMLYATAGDGASFGATDYGNFGIPKNPLGDPPAGVGGTMTSPTARGGSSRSQSFRRPAGENVVLNGSLIRVDPTTGLGVSGNQNFSHADVDAKRMIAIGLRNPYRFSFHPTTGDIWIADVGGNNWEEINRLPAPLTAAPMKNFGWPCYEGAGKNSAWDTLNINICETLYTAGASAHAAPYYAYAHGQTVYSGDTCATGGSAITGVTFYPSTGGNYPNAYKGAMFFADLPRDCIFVVNPNATTGLPDMATRKNFVVAAANPVDLVIGPNNDLFYVDYGGGGGQDTNVGSGKIHRIRYQAPTAVASANPVSGPAPLVVAFNGSASTPGIAGDTLSYAWDLDGDGAYDDSTAINPNRTYTVAGTINTRLRVTDQRGGSNESAVVQIFVGTTLTPPVPVIDTPAVGLTWRVDDNISFTGHATDEEDGTIAPANLIWDVIMQHCPDACHEHLVQSFDGVASGSFPAPDHEYPSYLQLRLTATDSHGQRTTVTRDLQPQTVNLTFQTVPAVTPGLTLGMNLESPAAPFTRTVILGSANSLTAPNQSRGNTTYTFTGWSDLGAQNHDIVANANATYTATFQATVNPWTSQDIGAITLPAGTWSETGGVHTVKGGGADIWTAADEFRFTHQQLTGDGTITARVTSFTNTSNVNGKAGVMIRQNLNANSPHVMAAMPPGGTTTLVKAIKRLTAGATSVSETGPAPAFPRWVRVVRAGNTLTAYQSADGNSFTQLGTPSTISTLASTVYVGLAVTSHTDGTNGTAVFDNVSITTPTPLPPAPPSLNATAGNGQVLLSWNATSGATSYAVKRASTTGGPYSDFVQSGITATTFTNTGLVNGTTYYYVVTASNAAGEGGNSNQVQATPQLPPPPPVPSGLGATAGNGQVSLTWNVSSGATSYTVKRSLTAGGPAYDDFVQSGITATNYTSTGLTNGTTYYYVVSASNANGESANSTEKSATPSLPPAPPAPNLQTATAGNAQVALSWAASAGAASYTVKRSLTAGGPYTDFEQAGLTGTSFTNTGLTNGTTYFYVVTAVNVGGESPSSNERSATPQVPPPPPAPTNLLGTAGSTQVALSWTASAGATSYTVKRSLTTGGPYTNFTQGGITGTTYTNTGLTNGTTYFYVVTASNANGESGNSNERSATPTAPSAPISSLVVFDTATTNPPAGTDGIANSTQWTIQSNFAVNVTAFGDRTVKVTSVPAAAAVLNGKAWIRTAADSKNYTGTPLATFTVGGTFVYLAVDNRHNPAGKPAWLDATYTDQGYDITITEGTTARPYSVYRKSVTAGSTVTLPTIGSSVAPCYIVIVQ